MPAASFIAGDGTKTKDVAAPKNFTRDCKG